MTHYSLIFLKCLSTILYTGKEGLYKNGRRFSALDSWELMEDLASTSLSQEEIVVIPVLLGRCLPRTWESWERGVPLFTHTLGPFFLSLVHHMMLEQSCNHGLFKKPHRFN